MIAEEAVEAAARGIYRHLMPPPFPIWAELSGEGHAKYRDIARAAIEAAAPHMLSHEREQARLAHLDAMVNRETKREELASAWDEGEAAGQDNADSNRGYDVEHKHNPYRPTL